MLYFKSHRLKFIILLVCFTLLKMPLFAAKPIAGIVGVKAENLRVTSISQILENQLISVINSTGSFSILNPDLLKDQLTRYGCTDEECILAFARAAKINLIIKAYVEDKGNSLVFNIYSQSIDPPYYGKIVYKYRAEIPLSGLSISVTEHNYIAEEHAAYFAAGLLRNYKSQQFINIINNLPAVDYEENVYGNFDLYRYDDNNQTDNENIRTYKTIGKVSIDNKNVKIISGNKIVINKNDFIFLNFNKKAEFIDSFFIGRKRELVFENKPYADTAVLFFSTVPASALMPLVAPLGYYKNCDYSGLSLWALNAFPYLYLEYKGLTNRPDSYKEDNKDISRQTAAQYRFGLYMLFCGGMPLVIDAFSNRMLFMAASYQGKQHYIGNTMSAVYLSLISGGGGMFYKGYRPEGYLYFHLHNILLYMAIKEFSASEIYNRATDSYSKHNGDKKKGYGYLGALTIVKIIEITRVILVKDNIKNGTVIEESFGFEPAVYKDAYGLGFGAQYTLKY
ncbi:MAG: hypothetical protein V1874_07455 [Spirochaetota bacterium]